MQTRTRFEPSDLNSMLDRFKNKYACEEGFISVDSGEHGLIIPQHPYIKWHCVHNDRHFVICKLAKDAQSKTNEAYLPYIGELIQNYKNQYPDSKATLVVPMRQCRGYAKVPATLWSVAPLLQCQHVVLVEVNLARRHIALHNSQTSSYTYPDKLVAIANSLDFKYDAYYYETQKDSSSCGYYVWAYIRSLLRTGTTDAFPNISLDDELYDSKKTFVAHWDEVDEQHLASSGQARSLQ